MRERPVLFTSVAVAPALNFSGSSDFDPIKVADLMASEISQLHGVGVIGVNRVLAMLADEGADAIRSPEHALAICDRLGSDSIVVFAVTEYDAYTPVLGLAAQLYGRRESTRGPGVTAQPTRPFPVDPHNSATRPWAQTQRTFQGQHEGLREQVKEYTRTRLTAGSPYGWRKGLVSQEWFVRYGCHEVARDLLEPPSGTPLLTSTIQADHKGAH